MATVAYLPTPTGVGQDYAGIPKPDQPLTRKGDYPTTPWWRFFLMISSKPVPESAITIGASPTAFTAPAKCNVLVLGASVSSLVAKRLNSYTLSYTQGYVPMSQGDVLTVTYSGGTPTMTYFPT